MVDATDIDALLPQTQCGECGYPGCMPYARALVSGQATIDRCPPGGGATLRALGAALNVDPRPYLETVIAQTRAPAVAFIREESCIGCTKCIQACPVDAIIGSAKHMHSIITHECTGCGLCVDPCPVDCIEMLPLPAYTYDTDLARERFHAKTSRLLDASARKRALYREKRRLSTTIPLDVGSEKIVKLTSQDKLAKQDYILQALQRVALKKQAPKSRESDDG
jgi:electron transport complex protein RnfB